MGNRAFLIAGSRAAVIANDNGDVWYRAAAHYLPVGVQVAARHNEQAETQLYVEDGIIEFMIGGAAAMVLAGDFVRVPAAVHYAYRNAGDATARLLVRSLDPRPAKRSTGCNTTFAA